MRCEKCGKEIDQLMINFFNRDGSDSFINIPFSEYEENAIGVDITSNWTGYELSDEDKVDTIKCPVCGEFPFKSKEIQEHEILRVVCFKEG